MTREQHAFAKSQDADIDTPAENHWPLAIMLIATQVSVGVLAVERGLAAIHLLGFGVDLSPKASLASALVALVVAGAGLAIAPLHLGQPLRAWRIFLGLRTSWLSREAVLFGKYMGVLALATLLLLLEQFPTTLPLAGLVSVPDWAVTILLTIALGVGVAGLLSSGMIYIATERQLWTNSRTFTRFLGSSAIAGLLGVGAVLLAMTHQSTLATVLLLGASIVAAAKLRWEWNILLGPDTAGDSSYDLRSKRLVRERLQVLRQVRIATGLTACLLALVASVACATAGAPISLSIGLSAMAAFLIGETCERLLYFSSVVYDRMPGAMA